MNKHMARTLGLALAVTMFFGVFSSTRIVSADETTTEQGSVTQSLVDKDINEMTLEELAELENVYEQRILEALEALVAHTELGPGDDLAGWTAKLDELSKAIDGNYFKKLEVRTLIEELVAQEIPNPWPNVPANPVEKPFSEMTLEELVAAEKVREENMTNALKELNELNQKGPEEDFQAWAEKLDELSSIIDSNYFEKEEIRGLIEALVEKEKPNPWPNVEAKPERPELWPNVEAKPERPELWPNVEAKDEVVKLETKLNPVSAYLDLRTTEGTTVSWSIHYQNTDEVYQSGTGIYSDHKITSLDDTLKAMVQSLAQTDALLDDYGVYYIKINNVTSNNFYVIRTFSPRIIEMSPSELNPEKIVSEFDATVDSNSVRWDLRDANTGDVIKVAAGTAIKSSDFEDVLDGDYTVTFYGDSFNGSGYETVQTDTKIIYVISVNDNPTVVLNHKLNPSAATVTLDGRVEGNVKWSIKAQNTDEVVFSGVGVYEFNHIDTLDQKLADLSEDYGVYYVEVEAKAYNGNGEYVTVSATSDYFYVIEQYEAKIIELLPTDLNPESIVAEFDKSVHESTVRWDLRKETTGEVVKVGSGSKITQSDFEDVEDNGYYVRFYGESFNGSGYTTAMTDSRLIYIYKVNDNPTVTTDSDLNPESATVELDGRVQGYVDWSIKRESDDAVITTGKGVYQDYKIDSLNDALAQLSSDYDAYYVEVNAQAFAGSGHAYDEITVKSAYFFVIDEKETVVNFEGSKTNPLSISVVFDGRTPEDSISYTITDKDGNVIAHDNKDVVTMDVLRELAPGRYTVLFGANRYVGSKEYEEVFSSEEFFEIVNTTYTFEYYDTDGNLLDQKSLEFYGIDVEDIKNIPVETPEFNELNLDVKEGFVHGWNLSNASETTGFGMGHAVTLGELAELTGDSTFKFNAASVEVPNLWPSINIDEIREAYREELFDLIFDMLGSEDIRPEQYLDYWNRITEAKTYEELAAINPVPNPPIIWPEVEAKPERPNPWPSIDTDKIREEYREELFDLIFDMLGSEDITAEQYLDYWNRITEAKTYEELAAINPVPNSPSVWPEVEAKPERPNPWPEVEAKPERPNPWPEVEANPNMQLTTKALEEKIEEALSYKLENYTKESGDRLLVAIKSAQDFLETVKAQNEIAPRAFANAPSGIITNTDVDNEIANLQKAIDQLKEIIPVEEDPKTPVKPSEPGKTTPKVEEKPNTGIAETYATYLLTVTLAGLILTLVIKNRKRIFQ